MIDKKIFIIGKYYGKCHELTQRLGSVEHKLTKQYREVVQPLNTLFDSDLSKKAQHNQLLKELASSNIVFVTNDHQYDKLALRFLAIATINNKTIIYE